MKNTFGNSLSVTLFGESHGPAVGAVIDGIAPGLEVDDNEIKKMLARRRPVGMIDTDRVEDDDIQIVSGVFEGKTTGTPLCISIANKKFKSGDYERGPARPSHADFSAFCKYHGFEDFRGGGHFSGRVTAALTAVGGILIPALERLGIRIGTQIIKCASVSDRPAETPGDLDVILGRMLPVLDEEAGENMRAKILDAKERGDSIGGVTRTSVFGLPPGLGEPWFDSAEGMLSHALFSIGGIKGVEFGLGFGFSETCGSACNDAFYEDEDGKIVTRTNNNGGINGGITNGMPVVFSCAVKPTPSIAISQDTVDMINGGSCEITVKGRHDPTILRRVCPVIDSVTAIVICDMLAGRYGTDVLTEGF